MKSRPLVGGCMAALSFRSTSTIAAPCAGRTLARVVAIRKYSGGEDPCRGRILLLLPVTRLFVSASGDGTVHVLQSITVTIDGGSRIQTCDTSKNRFHLSNAKIVTRHREGQRAVRQGVCLARSCRVLRLFPRGQDGFRGAEPASDPAPCRG